MVRRNKTDRGTRSVFLKWLLAILFWWRRKAPPAPVKNLRLKVNDMTDKTIVWKDPVVRTDGTPLAASEIARLEVGMKVAGAPDFTTVAHVAPGVQSFTQTDLPPGDYEFSVAVVDTQLPAKTSAVATVAVSVAPPVPVVLAAPGPVTDLTAL